MLLCPSAAICLGNCLNRPLKGLFMYNYFQIRPFDTFPLSLWWFDKKSSVATISFDKKIEISIEGSAVITAANLRFLRVAGAYVT